jgi:pimeloyl-ACP methyl ester carboxylesterase
VIQTGARFREAFIDADGFRIRYLEAGEGAPVITLHGEEGLDVGLAEELLANQYRVVALEMPGFGASPVNDRTRSARELARTLALAASQLEINRFSLIGASFGGRVAMRLALDYPDQVDALVLAAPTGILRQGLRGAYSSDGQTADLYAHPERRPEAAPQDPATVRKQQDLLTRIGAAEPDAELEAQLGDIQAATLVLFGTRDAVTSSDLGRIYREKIPNCSLVLVYDAAHAIASDRPEAYASTVSDFLERREVFVVSRDTTVINP